MKKSLIILLIIFFNLSTFAQIITVKQDSTGDYLHIQQAVNSANNYDTILIWPGTYYENVDLLGKGITMASLALTTGDISYKYSTIINGNKTGSCVLILDVENTVIYGLTLTNGSGYLRESIYDSASFGGGIYCENSNLNLIFCVISHNTVNSSSGGILIENSDVYLSGTSIFKNHSLGSAGGVGISSTSNLFFDSYNKSNIYLNSASVGCDFLTSSLGQPINIVADTFSVLNPGTFFINSIDINGYPEDDFFTFDILHQKIEPYDGDLYVNPISGCDTNSGISPDQPLKTIFYALSKIVEDSINRNTIHLANGVYSDTANGEKFPLNVRSNVIIEGETMDGVIWDGRDSYRFLRGNNLTSNYAFKKITMTRGRHKFHKDAGTFIFYLENSNILLDSITVKESVGFTVVANFIDCNNAVIKNSTFKNNKGGNSAVVAGLDFQNPENSYRFINCKFINNIPDYENTEFQGGGGLSFGGAPGNINYNNPTYLINCLFAGNNDNALVSKGCPKPFIINCTFADNIDSGLNFWWGSDAKIYNSVIYNNDEYPIVVANFETSDSAILDINRSLVDGGEESIILGDNGYYNYGPYNIDTEPGFLNMWGDPYMISDNSECIDAGSMDNLPENIEMPEFDLAGNPRVYGDNIDIGAYEWNPTIVGINEIGSQKNKRSLLKASPNPFDWGTYIEVEVEKHYQSEEIKVDIYDNYGRLVRNILSGKINENTKILWYGDDNNGNKIPSGIYNIILFVGDKEIQSLKVVKR